VTSDPGRRLAPIVRTAPAKLNLTLAVLGSRDDGYHPLHSIMSPLALCDRLSVAAASGPRDTLSVVGRAAGPSDDDLVIRAVRATREAVRRSWPGAPGEPPSLAARLDKQIPVAAGLGGGSSDAAAAIEAALEAWGAHLTTEDRLAVALSLGSDVPFFQAGGVAVVEGHGERVTALPALTGGRPGVLLVTPDAHVSTAAVFVAYAAGVRPDDGGAATRATSVHLAEELGRGMDAAALIARAGILATANDLIVAAEAVVPGLTAFRRALGRIVHRPVGQSGSGPTMWALYPSESEAAVAADAVGKELASGSLVAPGDGAPFISATSLDTGGHVR